MPPKVAPSRLKAAKSPGPPAAAPDKKQQTKAKSAPKKAPTWKTSAARDLLYQLIAGGTIPAVDSEVDQVDPKEIYDNHCKGTL